MADNEVCKTGLWVDSSTGQVVTKQPHRGTQLVPPGGDMRPDRVRAVEAARTAAPKAAEPVAAPTPEPEKVPARKAVSRSKG